MLWHNCLSQRSWFSALLCFVPSIMMYSVYETFGKSSKSWESGVTEFSAPCNELRWWLFIFIFFNFSGQKIPQINLVGINKKHYAAAPMYDHSTQKIVNWPLLSFLNRKGCSPVPWLLAWIWPLGVCGNGDCTCLSHWEHRSSSCLEHGLVHMRVWAGHWNQT